MHYPELWFKGISNHIQDWRRLAREARRNAQQLTKPYSVIKILLFRCAIFTLPFSLTVDIHAMLWVISLLPHLLCIVSFCLSRNVTLAWWLICHHYFRDCLLNCSCHMYNIQQSYHNEHTHFCREMCNIVNTRFLRPFGVITEITTKSPRKLRVIFLLKSHFFPIGKLLTLSP